MSSGPELPLLDAPEEVLSTLNQDGSRRWIRPRVARGRWWKRRAVVAWALIALFNVLPWLEWGGKPFFRLDVLAREFTFFTVSFRPTDTLLLTLLLLTLFFAVFLMTALFGRVWCGWGCPQTVYLEFVFRPLENWISGPNHRKGKPVPMARRLLKLAVFSVIALHLSHTFLAYFVGPSEVLKWSIGSPAEHPAGFAIVLGVAGLMLFDFLYFREQMCILACPYGRLQSVLLDRKSLVVGYDEKRGEPRGKQKKAATPDVSRGSCIDCGWCTAVCPTGIDIRDGLQMECVHCTECIDACDHVMDKIGEPRGLIRYSSQDGLAGVPKTGIRPRVVLYPLIVVVLASVFLWKMTHMQSAVFQPMRVQGMPYTTLESGEIRCLVPFRVENRSGERRSYSVSVDDARFQMTAPNFPLVLEDGESRTFSLIVIAPLDAFERGKAEVPFQFSDGVDLDLAVPRHIAGPYVVE